VIGVRGLCGRGAAGVRSRHARGPRRLRHVPTFRQTVDLPARVCNNKEVRRVRRSVVDRPNGSRGARRPGVASILLIDDDIELTHFLRAELEALGHTVECLERAEQGPELLAATHFDLVLLDNKMPGMTGIEFLDALQRRGVGVPVILMTGYSTFDTAIEAMDLGAFDYVIKPDDYQSLLQALVPLIAKALEITRPPADVPVAAKAPPVPADGPMLIGKSMVVVAKQIGRFA